MADSPSGEVTLAPRYGVPLGVVALGLTALPLQGLWSPALWLSLVVSLFGLFLLLQSVLLRLTFTADALLVLRQHLGTLLGAALRLVQQHGARVQRFRITHRRARCMGPTAPITGPAGA